MNLYELTREFTELQALLDSLELTADGSNEDLQQAVRLKLDEVSLERTAKLEGCLRLIKNFDGWIESIDTEIGRLKARKERIESQIESIKSWAGACLGPTEKFMCPIGGLSWRESTRTDVVNEDLLPMKFKRKTITFAPDKTKLKPFLEKKGPLYVTEGDKDVLVAQISKHLNLQVK